MSYWRVCERGHVTIHNTGPSNWKALSKPDNCPVVRTYGYQRGDDLGVQYVHPNGLPCDTETVRLDDQEALTSAMLLGGYGAVCEIVRERGLTLGSAVNVQTRLPRS